MHETKFVHLPPPSPVTKGLGIAAGITAISFVVAWAVERHRRRDQIRVLASMPGAASIFPALRAHTEMVLSQFGVGLPSDPDDPRP